MTPYGPVPGWAAPTSQPVSTRARSTTLRMPEVTVTDSQGRQIVISPEQADLVGCKMSSISDWIREGADD